MSSNILASTEAVAYASSPGDEGERANPIIRTMSAADAFACLATSVSSDAVRRAQALDLKADPEILHKLRVALRRLRSLWWAYQPLLDRNDSELQRGEFKSLANAAGKTRDWDVLRDLLAADQSLQHEFASLLESVDEHRAAALSFSRSTIGNAGVKRIIERALTGARHQLGLRAVSPTIDEFALERVESAEKAVRKRSERVALHGGAGYAALHDVRIAGKKLRYLLEFFSPVLDGSREGSISRLTSVQDELGKLNDVVTSEMLLREYSFQLREPKTVEAALRYLEELRKRRTHAAREILRRTG